MPTYLKHEINSSLILDPVTPLMYISFLIQCLN